MNESRHAVPTVPMPTRADEITPELLNPIIRPWHPDIRIEQVRVVERKEYGDGMISTAARAVVDVWEICVLNHLRLTTAFEDHDTAKLVAEIL